jgi:hypothetical protein
MGVGFSGPQQSSAEFPGLTASIAVILPKTSKWGAGLVAETDSSYLSLSKAVGPRIYGRSGPLYSGHATVTYFAQLLIGRATGRVEGVFRSEGGRVVEPGVGLDYGAGAWAARLQVGSRKVSNGVIYDSRVPGAPTSRLSGLRVVVGVTGRIGPH